MDVLYCRTRYLRRIPSASEPRPVAENRTAPGVNRSCCGDSCLRSRISETALSMVFHTDVCSGSLRRARVVRLRIANTEAVCKAWRHQFFVLSDSRLFCSISGASARDQQFQRSEHPSCVTGQRRRLGCFVVIVVSDREQMCFFPVGAAAQTACKRTKTA